MEAGLSLGPSCPPRLWLKGSAVQGKPGLPTLPCVGVCVSGERPLCTGYRVYSYVWPGLSSSRDPVCSCSLAV